MQRFADQPLRERPHIAVFSSTKVGNFVVTIPLLRGLKEKYPGCVLDFFGSEITHDFEIHCPYIDFSFPLYNRRPDYLEALTTAVRERVTQAGPYDLAVNCDEFSELNLVAVTALRPQYIAGAGLTLDFRRKLEAGSDPVQRMLQEDNWNSPEFLHRYRDLLTSNYIAEIFCRLAYVETDFFRLELPSRDPDFAVPDVLVHITTTRSAKMWRLDYWKQVIEWCEGQGLQVGLIGSAPDVQRALYHAGSSEDDLLAQTGMIDLRGKTSLIELAGALKRAKVCISVDAGPMHIAAAVGCPTIALFGNDADGDGASPVRLWAPRMPHVYITQTTYKCRLCLENKFKNEGCLVEGHPCMAHLPPETVIRYLQEILQKS
ncbi:glycosyltransferase family 9 protein [Thermostichus vulcanus]|uniref:Glycosyltransferase family 9 protein n=1 Tax=Thermostichus vulcanus str. 'Rupite' TaxID=2813851 RepID=A0ABT0C9U3_THEVL|nr:glycosyltransferase family 9 protein [Thermostichus vulcanus]MCJ2542553.1 glycosyltransferase family 9 protein [Thermostichus vulcanus str. 'Rupite']